jgi:outer membrane protein OmpA-like peptidoglycan-associated protein
VSAILKQVIIRILRNKLIVIACGLIVLYGLAGFFLMPYLIKHNLPGMLKKHLGVEASIQRVKINPFAMNLEATGFQMKEPSGSALVGFQRLYVNFQASSLFRWALTFDEVSIDGLSVNVVIDPDGKLNLAKLAGPSKTTPAEPADQNNKLIRMILYTFALNQGRIDITDKRQPIPATESFYPLNIKLANISTLPKREGPYTLTATSEDGMRLQWSGDVSLQPVRSEGSLKFEQIPLATPWKFARSYLNIAPPEGQLSVETRYLIDLGGKATVMTLDNLGMRLSGLGLQLEGSEKPFLKLSDVSLDAEKLDLIQRKIDAVRFAVKGGDINVIMDKDGIMNVQRIMAASPDPATAPPTAPAVSGSRQGPWAVNISDVKLEGLALDYNDQNNKPPVSFSTKEIKVGFKADINTGSPSMQVKVSDFGLTLKQIALGFVDAAQPALQVGNLAVSGGTVDLSSRSVSIARLELSDGAIDVTRHKDGTINLMQLYNKDAEKNPPSKNALAEKSEPWSYVLENVAVSEFKTSITDATVRQGKPLIVLEKIVLNASHIDGKSPISYDAGLRVVQGGELKASGTIDPVTVAVKSDITVKDLSLLTAQPYLALQTADLTLNSGLLSIQGAFNRAANGGMTYKGMVGVAKLQIMENLTKDTLLGWSELKTSDLQLGVNPNGLVIDNLKLTGLEGKLIISEDKKINIVEAFKGEKSMESPPKVAVVPEVPGNTFPVKVNRLTMENGNLAFADFSLRPQFATRMHELKGVVIGISSTAGARTQVELDGRVDEYGTSRITGEINSFDPKQFTDITMAFRNLEMTNMTPYSVKFAGRKIDSGRLSVDLQYKIQNKQLQAKNKVILEKLKLGERVESPDAIHLPLDLAIAILKDSNGVIDLDLPVTGNLDDPDFHYGRIVWKALVNVLTKLVTAPFRALGALFGSSEELLDSVTFDAGSKDIPPPEQEKLLKLLEVLQKRPQLKLTITGRYSTDTDGQAIKELRVRRAVAEASGMKLEPGENPGPVDFSSPDSQKRLGEIYASRYGQEAYDAIVAQMTPKVDAAETENSKSKKKKSKKNETTPVVVDPGALSKLLYADLIKREQVDPATLTQLADDRAQVIAAKLSENNGLPQERISIKPSEGVKRGDALTSVLGLDAM